MFLMKAVFRFLVVVHKNSIELVMFVGLLPAILLKIRFTTETIIDIVIQIESLKL